MICRRFGFKSIILALMAGALFFSLTGCYLYPVEETPVAPPLVKAQDVTYKTHTVEVGDLRTLIKENATFVAESKTDVYFENRSGYIQKINVRYGMDVQAGDVLFEMDTEGVKLNMQSQSIAVKKAQMSLDRLIKQRDEAIANQSVSAQADRIRDEYDYSIQNAKLDLQQANIQMEQLQKQLNESQLIAPISGRVVYYADIAEGDYVSNYQVLCRIADLSTLQLEYSGNNWKNFELGMKCTATIKGVDYEAEVVMTFANAPSDVSESLKNRVRFDVPEFKWDSEAILLGETALITRVLESRTQVVVLPKALVKNYSGRYYVVMLEDGMRVERDVELGLETGTEVEVVSGLQVGELVIKS